MLQRRRNALNYLSSPGPAVGETPRRLLYRRGTLGLYHYTPIADEVYRVPVLLVMATTNRAYLFDLTKGQSLIEFLLHRGYDVYVIDWNPPTLAEQHLKIENYVLDFLPDCMRRVQRDAGVEDVTLIGYCMAGILSCLYAALHPKGPLKNLVCFTTPIDWSRITWARALTNPDNFDVDELVERLPIIPAKMIQDAFDLLRPAGRVAGQIRLWDNLWDEQYVKGYRMMTGWGANGLPLAGDYYRQIVKELVWKNGLVEGTLRLGGRPVRLEAITVPLLHVLAEHDSLVPPASGEALMTLAGSTDKEELIIPGGHVSLVAGPSAIKRMWPSLDRWLGKRSV
ncbi:alpha/beta fold hydrolase [Pseudomonas sp. PDM23]|nr:alpha/beta fold hydrolase [Pseudomonas sp. PDM23]MBD9672201.1 alpha/beta fold hydrolase [Pseudomonas sp. PDM21]